MINQQKIAAIIAAAGKGERMGGVEAHRGEAAGDPADRTARGDDSPVAGAVEVIEKDFRPEHDERREAEVRRAYRGQSSGRRSHPRNVAPARSL